LVTKRFCGRKVMLNVGEIESCESEELIYEVGRFNGVPEGDVHNVNCLATAEDGVRH
jgi:hypothetical protein